MVRRRKAHGGTGYGAENRKKNRRRGGRSIRLNLAWFKYYGLRFGLTITEAVNMRYGEMMDLIACDAIFNGVQQPKEEKKHFTFDEAIKLR